MNRVSWFFVVFIALLILIWFTTSLCPNGWIGMQCCRRGIWAHDNQCDALCHGKGANKIGIREQSGNRYTCLCDNGESILTSEVCV